MIHQWYNGTLMYIIVLNDLHIHTPLIYMAPKYLIEYHGITLIVLLSKNMILAPSPKELFLVNSFSFFQDEEKETIAKITTVQACLYKFSKTHVCV